MRSVAEIEELLRSIARAKTIVLFTADGHYSILDHARQDAIVEALSMRAQAIANSVQYNPKGEF